ncbi:LOW QUALITY PROTEIN: hypothetical protein HID58_094519 [Brassica napus]|uniref:Uncharacterized protein n=1 Tax=Brassica napus TaxID=3708 RepID=A0ABQ7X760_BRANA|nr:LOW QUALITY PROTEIN: hypothetical protein HID58_094519 [Brassica napus]
MMHRPQRTNGNPVFNRLASRKIQTTSESARLNESSLTLNLTTKTKISHNIQGTREFGFFQFLPLNSQTSSSQQLLSLSLCPHSTSDFIEKPSFYHHWPKKDENKVVGIDRYDDVDTSLRL